MIAGSGPPSIRHDMAHAETPTPEQTPLPTALTVGPHSGEVDERGRDQSTSIVVTINDANGDLVDQAAVTVVGFPDGASKRARATPNADGVATLSLVATAGSGTYGITVADVEKKGWASESENDRDPQIEVVLS